MTSRSVAYSLGRVDDEALLIARRALGAALAAASEETTFVLRPGATGVLPANVYTTVPALYAAFQRTSGPRIVQIDDTIVSPVVWPAGVYDFPTTFFVGSQLATQLSLVDGVVFTHLPSFTNIVVTSFAKTVPVHQMLTNVFYMLSGFAALEMDASATQPFLVCPSGVAATLIASQLSGIGEAQPGTRVIEVDGTGVLSISLTDEAVLADNTVFGTGALFLIVMDTLSFGGADMSFVPVQTHVTTFQVTVPNAQFIGFNPALVAADWAGAAPVDVSNAVNRMAALLKTLNGGAPIP